MSRGKKRLAVAPTAVATTRLPGGYHRFLADIKSRIRAAQVKAALAANAELIRLYWSIGRDIVERQQLEGWGQAIVERLSRDIRREFPKVKGFSPQNLWYMRAFYLAWSEAALILQRPVGELASGEILQRPVGEISSAAARGARKSQRQEEPPRLVAELPWGHNVILIEKLTDPAERIWYAQAALEHGWSRDVLVLQIESDLCQRRGRAVSNFARTLPAPESDLAVDDQMRQPEDKPSLGLLLCKAHNRLVAEYALRDIHKPIGVAAWAAQLTRALPKELRASLPTVEEIEAELARGLARKPVKKPASGKGAARKGKSH